MLKRIVSLILLLSLVCFVLPGLSEESNGDDELTEEELKELEELDTAGDEDPTPAGENVFHEKTRFEFDNDSPAIYTAKVINDASLLAEKAKGAERLYYPGDTRVDVLYVGSAYVVARCNGVIGYVKRDNITGVTAVDPVNTAPYGVQKPIYVAVTATECHVRKAMDSTADSFVVLNPGTYLTVWRVQDGWGIVPYWRTYGYIDMRELTDLVTVSPTDTPLSAETPIAAYTSYYKMDQTEINKGRIVNIRVACERLSRTMQPGEELDFNASVGPYKKALGYKDAWVLINGTSVKGSGGGTCQVSSTLYNALLQLPGIEILQRRPHGPGGASYLPHGVDAAVGNDKLNLRFANGYDFPIRIDAHTTNDGALCMVIYRADMD